jgi:heptose I phosphotransferase
VSENSPNFNASLAHTLDGGKIRAHEKFLPLFRANDLEQFEKIMSIRDGEMARRFPGRTTVKLKLRNENGNVAAVYLKRYENNYLSIGRRILRVLGWPSATDEAAREWNALHELIRHNIGTAQPVAFGQQKIFGTVVRSFVMTEEIAGGEPADVVCRKLDFIERRKFAREIGALTRRFHESGFVHKDFYLGHIFVVAGKNGERQLRVIDLQRVIRPTFFKTRWRIKDLGALTYSASNSGMSKTDLMRIFKTFLENRKLDAKEKRLARKIARRVAWLRTRRPKHDDSPASAHSPR